MKNGSLVNSLDNVQLTEHLHKLLADYQVYFHNLQNFHWNITGRQFYSLHEQFEDLYRKTLDQIDDVAERIRFYDRLASGSMTDFVSRSNLEECQPTATPDVAMYRLLTDLEYMIASLQRLIPMAADSGDFATEDMLVEQLRDLQNDHWQARAWLSDTNIDKRGEKSTEKKETSESVKMS